MCCTKNLDPFLDAVTLYTQTDMVCARPRTGKLQSECLKPLKAALHHKVYFCDLIMYLFISLFLVCSRHLQLDFFCAILNCIMTN